MSINLDAIRNRLNSIQNKTTKKSNLFRPEPGKTEVRMVPYKLTKIILLLSYTFTMVSTTKTFYHQSQMGTQIQ